MVHNSTSIIPMHNHATQPPAMNSNHQPVPALTITNSLRQEELIKQRFFLAIMPTSIAHNLSSKIGYPSWRPASRQWRAGSEQQGCNLQLKGNQQLYEPIKITFAYKLRARSDRRRPSQDTAKCCSFKQTFRRNKLLPSSELKKLGHSSHTF